MSNDPRMGIDTRRKPDPTDTNGYVEPVQENRYAPLYQVVFRDKRKPIHGTISSIEPRLGYFLFLERGQKDQLGMLGHNGVRYTFDECRGVYEEDYQNPGCFNNEDLIALWKINAGLVG